MINGCACVPDTIVMSVTELSAFSSSSSSTDYKIVSFMCRHLTANCELRIGKRELFVYLSVAGLSVSFHECHRIGTCVCVDEIYIIKLIAFGSSQYYAIK